MERKKTKESCSTFGFKVYESTFLMPDVRFENELVIEIQSAYGEQGVTLAMKSYQSCIQGRIRICATCFCLFKIGADKASRWTSVASTWRCGFDCWCSNLQTSYDWNESEQNISHFFTLIWFLHIRCIHVHSVFQVVVRRMTEARKHWSSVVSNLGMPVYDSWCNYKDVRSLALLHCSCSFLEEKCQILQGTSGLPPGTTLKYAELEALCALQPSGEVCLSSNRKRWHYFIY